VSVTGTTDGTRHTPGARVMVTSVCSQPEAGDRKEVVMSPYVCAR
jgi:hypothetical protein